MSVPESKGRGDGKRRFRRDRSAAPSRDKTTLSAGPNPSWYAPVMVGLMVIGLLWIVAFYLTASVYPVPALGNWNLAVGFGLIIAGFLMTTNWR